MMLLRGSIAVPVLGLLLIAGCSSNPERYPGTDVLGIPGLEVDCATDLVQSGGTLQSGTLVYKGEGDLKEIFQTYVHAMEREGWMTTYANFSADAGTAVLRKDKRVARIAFSNGRNKMTASIQVGPATLSEPDTR
jgi:hypothetical protein